MTDNEIKRRDTEIDILIRKNEALKDEVSELQHKIVNCNAEIKMLKEAYIAYEETTGLKKAKAEAIKEFAERLYRRIGYCDLPNIVVKGHIDNLAKEMVGDEK